jgi:hypothetical protein
LISASYDKEEKMRILLSILGFVLLAQVAVAQVTIMSTCPADAPVSVQTGVVTASTSHFVSTFTNIGPKPITAVIFSWRVTDSVGAFYAETSTVDYAPSGILLESGKSSQTDVDLSVEEGRTLKTVEVACLVVLYQGKEVWGDPKSPEVARLRGVRQGIAAERKRLLHVYEKEGIARLSDELNRPVVR